MTERWWVAPACIIGLFTLILSPLIYLICTRPPPSEWPCEAFRQTPVQHVPARCAKYYRQCEP